MASSAGGNNNCFRLACLHRPRGPPILLYNSHRFSFPGQNDRSLDLITHSFLAPRLINKQGNTSTPTSLLSACYGGNFTFYCAESCCATNNCLYGFLVYPFDFYFPRTVTNILTPIQYRVITVYSRIHARTCVRKIFIISNLM